MAYGQLRLVFALNMGFIACDAQGSEAYLGEPLLQLHGKAVVTTATGGEAVEPALCFRKAAPMRLPESAAHLPDEIREAIPRSIELDEALKEISDKAALWSAGQLVEIVEVESVGRFPTEFNIEAYLPPSDEFIQPLFEGEPPIAEGFLCAVREGHPRVVNKPHVEQGTRCEGEGEGEGPCKISYVMMSYDSDAYYIESYDCPSVNSASSECERTTRGDEAVRRNMLGSFIEGSAQPALVYLAAPAKPGSYTAWKYGAPDGLAAGFHLFAAPPLKEFVKDRQNQSQSCHEAHPDATQQIRTDYADRVETFEAAGVYLDNIQSDPILRNAFEQRFAELTMQRCTLPPYEEISHTQSIELFFSNPQPLELPADLLRTTQP